MTKSYNLKNNKVDDAIQQFNENLSKYGLNVRLVVEQDAVKILAFRTDEVLSKHIHKTENSLEKQLAYIKDYKTREKRGIEYYFAFSFSGKNEPIGFYRIHDIDYNKKSFGIGSWIFEKNASENSPIIADVLTKDFAFNQLHLDLCYFDVRRNNKKVYRYHMLYSPVYIREDEEENNFFYLRKEDFEKNKQKILQLI
jgi:hypothetical protein